MRTPGAALRRRRRRRRTRRRRTRVQIPSDVILSFIHPAFGNPTV